MLCNIGLIRNLGRFDSVNAGAQLPLNKLALIYAENGQGKTTVASILRSLGDKNALPILERTRLGGQGSPHIVINNNSQNASVFQDGVWSDESVNIKVFDDHFVADNIYSGIEVGTGHRQNLHDLIIGAQGIQLSNNLQQLVERNEQHNHDLREKAGRITAGMRHGLSVDEFCNLENIEDIDSQTAEAERSLLAAKKSTTIAQRTSFITLSLPSFDIDGLNTLLGRALPDIEAEVAAQVQAHIASLGNEGESWVARGMEVIDEHDRDSCPFCKQELLGSEIIAQYQSIFSQEYQGLKGDSSLARVNLDREHRAELMTAFERNIRKVAEDCQFWGQFIQVPDIDLDTAEVARLWRSSFDAIQALLRRKQESPLEILSLDEATIQLVDEYHEAQNTVSALSAALAGANEAIVGVREAAAGANVAALQVDLDRLMAVKSRFSGEVSILCDDYLQEKVLKAGTEHEREAARELLNQYREQIFPQYQDTINRYLTRFNAGYRLDEVSSVNNRGGSSCNYSVLIENIQVPLHDREDGTPSFKTTLSSGDRNALALAFFFASIEVDADRENLVVVIDDPMTSLDEHRSLTTLQQINNLVNDVEQVIVLSHSKPFLCGLWNITDKSLTSVLKISRAGNSSTLSQWDVTQDCITEHDRNCEMVNGYIEDGQGEDARAVATALRPVLEAYVRITCPRRFPPGSLLGQFIGTCRQLEGTQNQILTPENCTELRALLDYANQFHHETNQAYQTAHINEQELLGQAQRTMEFVNI